MWVVTQGDQKVTPFTVNLTTGTVSQVGSAVATGATPLAMAITPDAKSLFVANAAPDNSVSAYTVNSDGSLTAQGTATPVGQLPVALAVDPSSKFLFVANENSSTISVFSISGTSLTKVGAFSSSLPGDVTGNGPAALVTSPSGNYLYVANQFTNTLGAFSYDATGALTLIAGYATGNNPSGLAFSRCAGITTATTNCPTADGNNLFVADSGSNSISVFAACIQASATCGTPNGTLAPVSGSPFGAGVSPVAFMIHPAFNFVYAVDSKSNQVSEYSYSPATGALTALSPAAASAGSNPLAGGITSNSIWAYVTNNGGSNLSVFSVGPAGILSPATTASIALSGQPSAIIIR
jgi:6-phosphogluconolactonase (cycloisomerase 2 family)